jgi:hypothetical protein
MTHLRITTMAVLLLGMAFIPACLELGTTNESAAGGTGTKGDCSQKTQTCDQCQVCERQTESGQCYKEYQACLNEPGCSGAIDCVNECPTGNSICVEVCLSVFKDVNMTFSNYYLCMYCGACSTSCAGAVSCAG